MTDSLSDTPDASEPSARASLSAKRWAILAVVIAAIAILAGPVYKIGLLPLKAALACLAIGLIGGAIAALLNAVTIFSHWRSGGPSRALGIAGLLLSILVAGFIFTLYRTAQTAPAIHDITTNTSEPPQFQAVLSHRSPTDNSAVYDPAIIPEQLAAYPDIKPIFAGASPAEAFALAEKAARALGWELVAVNPETGTIEATDRSLWFGLKNDIAIRVVKDGLVTRIDLRSASRVGTNDLGANANRIRRFAAVYKDLVKETAPKKR